MRGIPSPPTAVDELDHDVPTGVRTRRLIGNGFPPRDSESPTPAICADPIRLCPRCGDRPVLAELQVMTGGLCWPCRAGVIEGRRESGRHKS